MSVERIVLGEGALLLRFPPEDPASLSLVHHVFRALQERPELAIVNLHPAYASLLVEYDPLKIGSAAVASAVESALAGGGGAAPPPGPLVDIPVHYGGEDGPDLEPMARELGLTAEAVVALHTAPVYEVAFLGYQPGFAYLAGLPDRLRVPRLASPRPRVPAGSVGIAGRQTGIYPLAIPGGWRLIGRTALALFDPARTPSALLTPGLRVRFRETRP